MTTTKVLAYLKHLNLNYWLVDYKEYGFVAIFTEHNKPAVKNFTQVWKDGNKWCAYLSEKDYFNNAITGGFFEN